MTVSPKQGVYRKSTLIDAELAEIKQLAQICQEHEPIDLRLNWDMLTLRTGDKANDLLYYRDDRLIGFFSLDGLGFDEAEGPLRRGPRTVADEPQFRDHGATSFRPSGVIRTSES